MSRRVQVDKNIAVQARVAGGDDALSSTARCSVCAIDYRYVKAFGSPRCPLCDARSMIEDMRQAIHKLDNQLTAVTDERDRLLLINNTVAGYNAAIEIMSSEDFAFIKGACYTFKQNPNETVVRATVTPARRVNGLMVSNGAATSTAMPVVDSHHCRSIGGVAAANIFHESASEVGLQRAMALMCRSFLGKETP